MKRKAISGKITVKNSEFMNAVKQCVAEPVVARYEAIVQGVKESGVVAALISSSNDSSVRTVQNRLNQ